MHLQSVSDIKLAATIARFSAYAGLTAVCALAIYRDAIWLVDGRKFTENSFTEWMQLAFLMLSVLVFLHVGKRFPSLRPVSYLIGGGLLVMLIRELDAYLDAVYEGAWLLFALVALAVTMALVHRLRQELADSIRLFLTTPASGLFVAGGLGIFVFSRLFGYKGIWKSMFQVDYLDPYTASRWVKNAVEEGSELFGYCLVFVAAIELWSFARRNLAAS